MALQSTAIVPSQAARPLRHWSDAALARARASVERTWNDWCVRWQLESGEASALNACDDEALPGVAWQRVAGQSMWLAASASDAASPEGVLKAALFGQGSAQSTAESPVALAVSAEAVADLLRSLGQLANASSAGKRSADAGESPSGGDSRRWSGALGIRLATVGDGHATSWRLHCSESVASVLCGGMPPAPARPHAPLVGVAAALEKQTLAFRVCLEDTPLTLGNVQSLRIGDVLPLAHRLDQPLRVMAPLAATDAPSFCAAYLGSLDNFRAVELIPAATASHSSDS